MPASGSNDLFDLIKSLDKSERRHFKLFASLYIGRKGNYIKLFDAISKQKQYDEKKILRTEKYIKQLPQLKNRLQEIILESLSHYYSKNSFQLNIKQQLIELEILYEKGQYKLFEKAIGKAKVFAYKHELFEELLMLIKSEEKIKAPYSYHQELMKERQNILKILENLNDYMKIESNLMSYHEKYGHVRSKKDQQKYQTFINVPHFKDESKALSFKAKNFYYHILAFYHWKTFDNLKATHYLKHRIELLESNPDYIKINNFAYLGALHNMCTLLDNSENLDEFCVYLERLRSAPTYSYNDEGKKFINLSLVESEFYDKTGEFEKGALMSEKVEIGIKKFKQHLSPNFEIILCYNIACHNFAAGQFSKALSWFNRIINYPTKIRRDAVSLSRIISLIIHYEKGNVVFIKYSLKSLYRFLRQNEILYEFENIILSFIEKKLIRITSKKELIKSFVELKPQLVKISKSNYDKTPFIHFDFISWLDSKIENKPFGEIVRKKLKK